MPSASSAVSSHDLAIASDDTLMSDIARGDARAFAELYRRHSAHVLILSRRLCASRELAEEVAQETFISLWRGAARYRPALGSVGVWLSTLLRNRAIDAWRRTTVRPVEVPALEGDPGQLHTAIGADTPAPERAVVLELMAQLPREQKEAVFLAYFGEMTHAEIAQWAGEPLGTIKGRIRLGLDKLRAGLDERLGASDLALLTPLVLAPQGRNGAGRRVRGLSVAA